MRLRLPKLYEALHLQTVYSQPYKSGDTLGNTKATESRSTGNDIHPALPHNKECRGSGSCRILMTPTIFIKNDKGLATLPQHFSRRS